MISFEGGAADLHVAHCTNAPCTASTDRAVYTTGTVGRSSSIVIADDGLPVVAHRGGTDALLVLHCGNLACTAGTETVGSSSTFGGWDAAITIGTDGMPILHHVNFDTLSHEVVHCVNVFCTPFAQRR